MLLRGAAIALLGVIVLAGCGSKEPELGSSNDDGPRIAFLLGDEAPEIWTASTDWGKREKVIGREDLDGLVPSGPRWSPDGQLLAFVAGDRNEERSSLFVSARDGSGLRRLTDGSDKVWSPSWSPDGQRLLFVHVVERGADAETTLETISVDGSDRKVLRRLGAGETNGFFIDADWSPSGAIAVGRVRPVAGKGELAIWLLEPDGNLRRLLTNATAPAWSPDGESLAFLRATELPVPCVDDCMTYTELYVANADGSGIRRVRAAEDIRLHDADRPSWSPEGGHIMFAGLDRGWDLYIVSERGDSASNLTQSEDWERSPDWTG